MVKLFGPFLVYKEGHFYTKDGVCLFVTYNKIISINGLSLFLPNYSNLSCYIRLGVYNLDSQNVEMRIQVRPSIPRLHEPLRKVNSMFSLSPSITNSLNMVSQSTSKNS